MGKFESSSVLQGYLVLENSSTVNFTTKTQFFFFINKRIVKIYDNKKVNEFMPKEDSLIPFDQMIYFGDENYRYPPT